MKAIVTFLFPAWLLAALVVGACAADASNGGADEYIEGNFIQVGAVYPFSDLYKLVQCADLLHEISVPFVCEVAPIFYNTDFPAMTRFCAVLRYVSDKGGTIVMRKPDVKGQIEPVDLFEEKVQTALDAYNENGVYPMRINVSDGWLSYIAEYDLQAPVEDLTDYVTDLLKAGVQIDSFYDIAAPMEGLKQKNGSFSGSDQEYVWRRGFEGAYKEDVDNVQSNLYKVAAGVISLFIMLITIGFRINKAKFARKQKRDSNTNLTLKP